MATVIDIRARTRAVTLLAPVLTGDARRPPCGHLTVCGDRIGSPGAGAGPTVSLPDDTMIVPGFVDPHLHLPALAATRLSVDVSRCRSVGAIVAVIASEASRRAPGAWIRARGYDSWRLAGGRSPDRDDLDRVTPAHPLVLHDATGHEAVANTVALRHLGVTDDDPVGAGVERVDGRATGRLHHAERLLDRVPRLPGADLARAAAQASTEMAAAGLTSVTDATHTNGLEDLELLARWHREGAVRQRVEAMIGIRELDAVVQAGLRFGAAPDGELTVGHVKLLPEADTGSTLDDCLAAARRHGFPVAIHALDIGPLQAALDALARAPAPSRGTDRIEHLALALPEQVLRLAHVGAAVVTQPAIPVLRGGLHHRELSATERTWLYRVASLRNAGVLVAASSDAPVTAANPLFALHAAAGGGEDDASDRRREWVSWPACLSLVTTAAGAVGARRAGTLTDGDAADFVILRVPDRPQPRGVTGVEVLATVIGGRAVHDPEGLLTALGDDPSC